MTWQSQYQPHRKYKEIEYFNEPHVEGVGFYKSNKNNKMQKNWYQSRTMWLAILFFIFGIVLYMLK